MAELTLVLVIYRDGLLYADIRPSKYSLTT